MTGEPLDLLQFSATVLREYSIFVASPGDMQQERRELRAFFEVFNRSTARHWGVRFNVVDWENYASAGVGRPQELITKQTLERFRPSLALVVGFMGQRFGSPTGVYVSGTQEEFEWAFRSHDETGFPEIKWFFRNVQEFVSAPHPEQVKAALAQWEHVLSFKQRLRECHQQLLFKEFADLEEFRRVVLEDIRSWVSEPERPWRGAGATHGTDLSQQDTFQHSRFSEFALHLLDVRLFLHSETATQAAYHDEQAARISGPFSKC